VRKVRASFRVRNVGNEIQFSVHFTQITVPLQDANKCTLDPPRAETMGKAA
jgi:hypothetical protein